MAAPLVAIKKVSLNGIYDGWDESCFAIVRPCNFKVRIEATEVEGKTETEQMEFQNKLVKEHFVSGKVMAYQEEKFAAVDLSADQAVDLPEVSNKLALFILGYDVDPKDLDEAVAQSVVPQSEPTDTETSSSEDSQEVSPAPSN